MRTKNEKKISSLAAKSDKFNSIEFSRTVIYQTYSLQHAHRGGIYLPLPLGREIEEREKERGREREKERDRERGSEGMRESQRKIGGEEKSGPNFSSSPFFP